MTDFDGDSDSDFGVDSGGEQSGESGGFGDGSGEGESGGSEGSNIQLTEPAEEVLQSLFDRGGEATTSEIKQDTGLTTSKIRYRLTRSKDALQDEYGLVSVSQVSPAEYSGTGHPPKRVELTRKGRKAISEGWVSPERFQDNISDEVSISREQFEEFNERVKRLEQRVNASLKGDSVDEGDVRELQEEVAGLKDSVSSLEGELAELRESAGASEELREKVFDEHEQAMVGMMLAFREEFGVDVNEYIDDTFGEDAVEFGR